MGETKLITNIENATWEAFPSFLKDCKVEEIIDKFREGKLLCLVCTAVLERGVTVKNLQVIIYDADNNIYNDKALLQISGRVGRVIKATSGDVYYVCKKKTEYMEKAIKFTILANSKL